MTLHIAAKILTMSLLTTVVGGKRIGGDLDDVKNGYIEELFSGAVSSGRDLIIEGDSQTQSVPWFAFIVSTYREDGNIVFEECGGTLIYKDIVATAAHCLDDKVQKIAIKIGGLKSDYTNSGLDVTFSNSDGHITEGSKSKKHEDFSLGSPQSDIALIKLATPVNHQNYAHMYVAEQKDSVIYLGHGFTTTGTEQVQSLNQLKFGIGTVQDTDTCKESYKEYNDLFMFCIHHLEDSPCHGDSGGPVRVPSSLDNPAYNQVAGIISQVKSKFVIADDGTEVFTCLPRKPTLVTRIDAFPDFILDNLCALTVDTIGLPCEQEDGEWEWKNSPGVDIKDTICYLSAIVQLSSKCSFDGEEDAWKWIG